ncbi:DNA-binding transcriptional regulator, FadR family [Chitinophaga jiangningensis]|uniref:DNA-binding transcriptional regulator, FadR family n=1 Tax=Chitinophaga jiangningensis TaxID=1419482 RepID=A0A1M7M2A5_9BACT|nr:FadR/GntR family transcriptional regulator [Chitinophaga jiangningensis]SHM84698.1 DNA-binding transcriptional regulator, FadR family [Chitinophaga jiangningensis]
MSTLEITKNLQSIDTSSLVDKVERKLIELLISKDIKVGDSIPKELELADVLGVSRTVVREALTRLKTLGLIETKKKRGAVLTNPDLTGLLEKSLYPEIMDKNTLREIFEMRLALEIGMADFIMERVTPEDVAALKAIVEDEPTVADQHLFQIEQEIRFHGKLYEISGNQVLKRFQQMLLPVFDYVHKSGLLKKMPKTKKFVSHKGLVEIIENGSAEMLRNAMRNHLENHFARIFE